MDQVRLLMRRHHSSIHTERAYCDWIKRFVKFHQMKSREDLFSSKAWRSSQGTRSTGSQSPEGRSAIRCLWGASLLEYRALLRSGDPKAISDNQFCVFRPVSHGGSQGRQARDMTRFSLACRPFFVG